MKIGERGNKNLYRGKRLDNGEWVYGYCIKTKWYLDEKMIHAIIPIDSIAYPRNEINYVEVDPKTVGQCTGTFEMKIGIPGEEWKEIYEGDILKCYIMEPWRTDNIPYRDTTELRSYVGLVKYNPDLAEFRVHLYNRTDERLIRDGRDGYYRRDELWGFQIKHKEIIGNIHDNPELLDEGSKLIKRWVYEPVEDDLKESEE